jgi:hypothetical protein
MEFLKLLMQFIKEIFVPVLAYKAGADAKENETIKAENETLKKYEDINADNITVNDAYDAGMYK